MKQYVVYTGLPSFFSKQKQSGSAIDSARRREKKRYSTLDDNCLLLKVNLFLFQKAFRLEHYFWYRYQA